MYKTSIQATSTSWKAAYHAARKARGGTAPAATLTQSSGPRASSKGRAERTAINQAATAGGTVLEKLKTGQKALSLSLSLSLSLYRCLPPFPHLPAFVSLARSLFIPLILQPTGLTLLPPPVALHFKASVSASHCKSHSNAQCECLWLWIHMCHYDITLIKIRPHSKAYCVSCV